jgi:hypothetical protein
VLDSPSPGSFRERGPGGEGLPGERAGRQEIGQGERKLALDLLIPCGEQTGDIGHARLPEDHFPDARFHPRK